MAPDAAASATNNTYSLGLTRLLRPGHWLAIRSTHEEDPQPYRLQWVSDDQNRFILAHYTGNAVVVYSASELAEGFASDRLQLTENRDSPLSQRQWERKIRSAHETIVELATHDAATGLLNRKALIRELQYLEERDRRSGRSHALLSVELHTAEPDPQAVPTSMDQAVIEKAAEALSDSLSEADLLARTAPARFAVLLTDHTIAKAEVVAEQQRRRLVQLILGERLTVSMGVVGFQFGAPGSPTQLLAEAETASHRVIEDGGGYVATIRSETKEMAGLRDNMLKAARLDTALQQGELQLRMQRIEPSHPTTTDPRHLYEILIAVASGENDEQLCSPAEFIPAVERFGRMASVDRWVIRHVLEWCRERPKQFDGVAAFTINLAGTTLEDNYLPDYLSEEFARTGVAPDKICFELSETVVVQNLARAADLITHIRPLGCLFALDDVGAGRASYAYLANLPVDYIKIDGGFIRRVAVDDTDAAMVRSINDLAHYLGKQTIAEYVENAVIRKRLVELGVDYVQGYGVECPETLEQSPVA